MDIIDTIKAMMEKRGMSMGELARRMSGNTATRKKDLSEILNRKREPGTAMLDEIAEGLNMEWWIRGMLEIGGEPFFETDLPSEEQMRKYSQEQLLKNMKKDGLDLSNLDDGRNS